MSDEQGNSDSHDAHGFWNDYYESNSSDPTDWILSPSASLTEALSALLPPAPSASSTPPTPPPILEIGCGTSTLSQQLASSNPHLHIIATDVSPVAITQNQERQTPPNLIYSVLDCITLPSPLPPPLSQKSFAVIFDKGCLDTFLFRLPKLSRPTAIKSLLKNINTLLTLNGVYIVMSPRKIIKELRDYLGFKTYTRSPLSLQTFESGELDGGRVQSKVYLHCCTIDESFDTSSSDFFRIEEEVKVCGGCGKVRGSGGRKWRNHVKHCKG
ncbi:hypothetical protein TrLO_g836 [Triparma laevis f. longispina]|nr:hypothetical protein TrLO_g836 [Triparma laevis f. longispina]